jgi:hypothetical protein
MRRTKAFAGAVWPELDEENRATGRRRVGGPLLRRHPGLVPGSINATALE